MRNPYSWSIGSSRLATDSSGPLRCADKGFWTVAPRLWSVPSWNEASSKTVTWKRVLLRYLTFDRRCHRKSPGGWRVTKSLRRCFVKARQWRRIADKRRIRRPPRMAPCLLPFTRPRPCKVEYSIDAGFRWSSMHWNHPAIASCSNGTRESFESILWTDYEWSLSFKLLSIAFSIEFDRGSKWTRSWCSPT